MGKLFYNLAVLRPFKYDMISKSHKIKYCWSLPYKNKNLIHSKHKPHKQTQMANEPLGKISAIHMVKKLISPSHKNPLEMRKEKKNQQ